MFYLTKFIQSIKLIFCIYLKKIMKNNLLKNTEILFRQFTSIPKPYEKHALLKLIFCCGVILVQFK